MPHPRPTVFMLPGIMGSELGIKQDRIWFDIGDLLLGGMEKLGDSCEERAPAAAVRTLLRRLATVSGNESSRHPVRV